MRLWFASEVKKGDESKKESKHEEVSSVFSKVDKLFHEVEELIKEKVSNKSENKGVH